MSKKKRIIEVKETLTGEIKQFTCQLLSLTETEAVVLYQLPQERYVEDLLLPAGTLTIGYFWTDRFYNAYHWITPRGETLGLYCNISDRTRITSTNIFWRDLIIDILITKDSRCQVLDEDELPENFDSTLRKKIEKSRDEILDQQLTLLQELKERSFLFSQKHQQF